MQLSSVDARQRVTEKNQVDENSWDNMNKRQN